MPTLFPSHVMSSNTDVGYLFRSDSGWHNEARTEVMVWAHQFIPLYPWCQTLKLLWPFSHTRQSNTYVKHGDKQLFFFCWTELLPLWGEITFQISHVLCAFSILYLNMEGTLLLYSLSKLSKSVSTEKQVDLLVRNVYICSVLIQHSFISFCAPIILACLSITKGHVQCTYFKLSVLLILTLLWPSTLQYVMFFCSLSTLGRSWQSAWHESV